MKLARANQGLRWVTRAPDATESVFRVTFKPTALVIAQLQFVGRVNVVHHYEFISIHCLKK
jgi:hypothetical protein